VRFDVDRSVHATNPNTAIDAGAWAFGSTSFAAIARLNLVRFALAHRWLTRAAVLGVKRRVRDAGASSQENAATCHPPWSRAHWVLSPVSVDLC
jgi:hypothetical protein